MWPLGGTRKMLVSPALSKITKTMPEGHPKPPKTPDVYSEKIRDYAYLSLTEKHIIYKDNSETRFYIENIDLTCKLHIKLTFS